MKYKEIYILIFSALFLFLASSLNEYVRTNNFVDPFEDIDSKAYTHNAERLYKHGSFLLKQETSAPYFSLGYPTFIAAIYKIFKPEKKYLIWVQILLTLLTCFLIYNISGFIFGPSSAVFAFVFSALNVGFITFSNFILTETILTFLLTYFLYLFVLFLHKRSLYYLFISGLILGGSIFIKPAAIYFIFPVLLLILFFNSGKKVKALLLFAASFYLPVVSYSVFNKISFGHFSVSTLANENLYFYFFPKVLACKNNTTIKFETEQLQTMLTGSKLDRQSWDDIKQYFTDTLKKDPILFAKVWGKNVFKTFVGLYSTNLKVLINNNLRGGDISFFKTRGTALERINKYIISGIDHIYIKIIAYYEVVWSVLRYLLLLLGLIFLIKKRDFKYLFLFAFYIFYFAMITGHDGCARFRMMFEPAIIILAAQGFYMVIGLFKPKSNLKLGEL